MAGTDYVQVFINSSPIIQVVYLVLLAMSLTSWTIIFLKLFQFRRIARLISADTDVLRGSGTMRTLLEKLSPGPESITRKVARFAAAEYRDLTRLEVDKHERARIVLEHLRHGLDKEIDGRVQSLFRPLTFLLVCASTAPLIGLFGTVWGIFHSFQGFTNLTRASSFQVVGQGLGEALGTTIAGLLVAIPATLLYNLLLARLGSIERGTARFSFLLLKRAREDLLHRSSPPGYPLAGTPSLQAGEPRGVAVK
jgi:biopolymer transport protein TolQ